jgi:hypothetical protein
MTDEELAEVSSDAAQAHLDAVDPQDVDADDLAWAAVRDIRKAEKKA